MKSIQHLLQRDFVIERKPNCPLSEQADLIEQLSVA